jgi:molecular chaperone GrpE
MAARIPIRNKIDAFDNEPVNAQTAADMAEMDSPEPSLDGEAEVVESTGESEELRRQLEEKDTEIQKLRESEQQANDQLLRALADIENVRRRSRQEREEVAQFGIQELLRDLLPVLDNFERAVATDNATVESMREGVDLILRQMQDVLKKHGVEPVPSVGQPFDTQQHEAIMRSDPTEEFPAGTVMDEMRKGYLLRGRLLRPSLVKVAQDE